MVTSRINSSSLRDSSLSVYREQLNIKEERRVRGDAWSPIRAVTEIGWNYQSSLSTWLHRPYTFVPSLDNLSDTNRKIERLVTVNRAVELRSITQSARVMHLHPITPRRRISCTDDLIDVLQAGRGCDLTGLTSIHIPPVGGSNSSQNKNYGQVEPFSILFTRLRLLNTITILNWCEASPFPDCRSGSI